MIPMSQSFLRRPFARQTRRLVGCIGPPRDTSLRFLSVLLCGLLGLSCTREESRTKLVVFGAASLQESFAALENSFEATHPGVDVVLHCAGSQELRMQLEQGAHADVFASADLVHMDKLTTAQLAAPSQIFARNIPIVVVAQASSGKIRNFSEVPSIGRIVIGTPEVPIGRYTEKILHQANELYGPGFRDAFLASVVSKELNVKQILAKVRLGEANAGIIYKTDLSKDPSLETIEVPESINVVAEYPIAILRRTHSPDLARAWVQLVLSEKGQSSLRAHGFLSPRNEG